MEWWKLFSSTFILIFLAELGDKTQLAAMAKTADSPGGSTARWVVFLGASLALVASTFIAVFLGQTLKNLIPDERYIKIAAGALFLIFGTMILYETYKSYRGDSAAEPIGAPIAEQPADPGLMGGLALRAAMDFEYFAGQRYRRLAENASPAVSKILLTLAGEERSHFDRLRNIVDADARMAEAPCDDSQLSDLTTNLEKLGREERATIDELIRHEETTADFYQHMANRALIPSVRSVLAGLAEEERNHARMLERLATTASGRIKSDGKS